MKPQLGDRLVQLRKLRGISQKNLAKLAKLSQRQLVRIEKSESKARNKTIKSLAKALRVDQGVLTGDLPIPQNLTDVGRKGYATNSDEQATISVKVSYDIRNWYDLVRHFYGVSMSDLVRVAPLLLVLLAEGSKKWQDQQNESTKDLLKQIKEKTKELPISEEVNTQCSYIEEKLPSIGKMSGRDLTTEHSFLRYLRAQAKESDRAQSIQFHQNNFVSYDLFQYDDDWAFLSSKDKKLIAKGETRFHPILVQWDWKLGVLIPSVDLLDEIIENIGLDIIPLIETIMSMEGTKENLKELHEELFSPEHFLEPIWEFLSKKGDQETFQFREYWNVIPGDSIKEKLKRFLSTEQVTPKALRSFITPEFSDKLKLICSELNTKEKIQDMADIVYSYLGRKGDSEDILVRRVKGHEGLALFISHDYLQITPEFLKEVIAELLTQQMKLEDILTKVEQSAPGDWYSGLINVLLGFEDD